MDYNSVLVDYQAARVELQERRLTLVENRAKLVANRDLLRGNVRAAKGRLGDGAQSERHTRFARLEAQLESLPVIEQAKGVLMCQSGCTAEEAFDVLRRASQRTNVKVRDLAARIVANAQATARER